MPPSETTSGGFVTGTRDFGLPDSWLRVRWAEIRQTRKKRQRIIYQPHLATHSTTLGNALDTITHSCRTGHSVQSQVVCAIAIIVHAFHCLVYHPVRLLGPPVFSVTCHILPCYEE